MNRKRPFVLARRRGAPAATAPRLRARPGFSLVELIVALMILAVGMLALVGTSLSVTRQMSSGSKRTLAANIAEMRFDSIRARGHIKCDSIRSSNTPRTWPGGLVEGWHAVRLTPPSTADQGHPDAAVMVTDSIMWSIRRGSPVKVVFQSVFSCAK